MLRACLQSIKSWLTRKPACQPGLSTTKLAVEALEARELMSANAEVFTLSHGNLYHKVANHSTVIDRGVEDFMVVRGKVYDLHCVLAASVQKLIRPPMLGWAWDRMALRAGRAAWVAAEV